MKYTILTSLSFVALLLFSCGKEEEPKNDNKVVLRDKMEIDQIVGIATIEPLERLRTLNAEVNGVISDVLIVDGQHVNKGESILVLDNQIENAQLIQAQSKLETQKAVIAYAKKSLQTREVQWKKSLNDLKRDKKLLEGNAITLQAFENTQFQTEQNEKLVQEATATLEQQEIKMNELAADIKYFQTLLQRRNVKSPLSGTFLSVSVRTGTFLTNTTPLGDFSPDGALMALSEVDELFADKVSVGQDALIRNQGDTKIIARGKVVFVGNYLKKKSLFSGKPDDLEDRRVREVRVQLDEQAKVLIGARVECVIQLK
ncbi:MAG: biotin/lipoyl-binding protein [Bacteroidetes bacterium]|nr:biotin/lipoyl-binding protein [Bacteroidota bacterium]